MKKKVAPKAKQSKSKLRDLPPRKNPRGGATYTSGAIVPCVKTASLDPCVRTTR